MRLDVLTVTENEGLEVALQRLQQSGRRSLPVVRGEELVGILPIENVAYVLQVRERERLAVAHA